jgi:ketol-acid reductoisomerase
MRDSGLDISYALRAEAISKKSFFTNAADNGFTVGTYEDLIPTADLVCNQPRQTAYCSSYYHALDEERIYISLFTWF